LSDIWVNILGDASKLKSAVGEAGKDITGLADKVGKIGKTMTIVGGAVTAAFGMIIKKTMDVGDQFDKMSLRTGESVENLSALAYACDITGTDIGGLEVGLKFLTKGMNDASQGTGEAKDAFEELGISITDTEGNLRPTVDVLKEAATKIAAIENPAKQAALAMELFGARSGTQLIPLLKEGGAGIEELMKKAEELGITISTDTASAAAELQDRLTDLKGSLAGVGRDIGMILIPPLTELVEKAVEMITKIKEWADAHKPLIEIIIKVGATLGVLAAVGGPILMAVSAFMKMKAAMALIGTITSGPIGIIIMAVGALALAWTTNFGGIRDFTDQVIEKLKGPLDWLSDKLDKIKEGVREFGKWLGIITEDLAGGGGAVGAFADEIASVADQIKEKLGGTIEELKKMADLEIILKPAQEAIKKIIDSMTPYEKQLEAINVKYDEAIEKIKTYITDEEELKVAIDKLNTGREAEITLLDRQETALEKAAEVKKKLVDLTKSLTDKIYEFTHTEEEVKLRDINREYDLLVENAKEVFESKKELIEAIKTINEKRQEEIDNIGGVVDKNKELVDSIAPIIEKTKEVTEAIKETGETSSITTEQLNEAFGGVVKTINTATSSLSNFTIAGVAAAIATIKMKFLPALIDLREIMASMSRSFLEGMLSAVDYNSLQIFYQRQINDILKEQKERVDNVLYGWKEYQNLISQMSSGGGAGGGIGFPSYQAGTRYVPKTSLALVHRGEEINPPGQRSYDQRKSYSSSSSINIGSGAFNVITPKFSEADGQEMFRIIERQAKMRGLKLVRE